MGAIGSKLNWYNVKKAMSISVYLYVYFMNTLGKLELLNANCSDRNELDRILSQLLSVMLNRHRQKLAVYDRDISKFEQNYRLDSRQFQEQFESGALGDEMELFEWFSLCELRKDLLVKISKLEQAL